MFLIGLMAWGLSEVLTSDAGDSEQKYAGQRLHLTG